MQYKVNEITYEIASDNPLKTIRELMAVAKEIVTQADSEALSKIIKGKDGEVDAAFFFNLISILEGVELEKTLARLEKALGLEIVFSPEHLPIELVKVACIKNYLTLFYGFFIELDLLKKSVS